MPYRAAQPNSSFTSKSFPFVTSGNGLLPVYQSDSRTTLFQSALKQVRNKYSQRLKRLWRPSCFFTVFLVFSILLFFLVWRSIRSSIVSIMNGPGIKRQNFSLLIDGSPTDFIIVEFQSEIMVVVTQIGKLGTLVQARQNGHTQTFSTQVLLGKRSDPLLEICGRQLIEKLALSGCSKDILLWLGLPETSRSNIQSIIAAVVGRSPWKRTESHLPPVVGVR